jgi:putative ABC transport system permease protein
MRQNKLSNSSPPCIARWILSKILPIQLKHTAYGDFEEIYRRILREGSEKEAKGWYWKHILMSALPFIHTTIRWRFMMITEYLKLTLRHIRRRKGIALVNIVGLAVGFASCILVFYFIRDELSFDRFHTHIYSIYEVKSKVSYNSGPDVFLETEGPVTPTLAADFEEVEAATRLAKVELIVKAGENIFRQKGIGVDPSFFDVFSFPLAQGHSSSALSEPASVVLSAKAARLLFGTLDPLGRIISIKIADETSECRVTGITKDIPANSSLKYDLLLPILLVKGPKIDQWDTGLDAASFIRLRKDVDPNTLEVRFQSTIDRQLNKGERTGSHYLFPFADYHKGARYYTFSSVLESRSSPSYSIILAGIAFLVLLVAGLNFLNLSIAVAAANRVKEIGIRKVLGAGKKQLLRQFRFEGIATCLFALAAGYAIAQIVLPVFNQFAGKALRLDLLGPGFPVLALIFFAVLLGALAGSYPGWFLLRVRPVDLFRGKFLLGHKNSFNRVFLLFQFGISIFLVITAGFLFRQHQHLLRADLGYRPERVVVLNIEQLTSQFQNDSQFLPVLKSHLLQYPEIKSVSGSYSGMSSWSAMITITEAEQSKMIVRLNGVDYDFIETLGIEMIDGRWFSSEYPSDKTDGVIVNEALVKKFNIEKPTERTLAEFIKFRGPGKIIGVIRDFHFDSLLQPIQPAILNLEGERFKKVFIRLEGDDPSRAIDIIEKEFSVAAPGYPFLFSFLDDEVASQYDDERRWGLMVTIVCIFATIIACAGVFALAMIAITRRVKEIGVRKVLGASVVRIVGLLAGEFMGIAGAAVLLAWPAAFLTMHKILAAYPHRTPLSFWVFVAGGIIVVVLMLATVGLQAVRAAIRNPVESLRYE